MIKSRGRLYYQALSVFIVCLFSCSVAFSEVIEGLSEIYRTPIPSEVRRNFDECIQIYSPHPKYERIVVDGDKFTDIYAKKFMVVGMEPNPFGGLWVIIAVEGNFKTAYLLWLYDIDRDQYDLRSVEKLSDFLDEKLGRQLSGPEYHQYWR